MLNDEIYARAVQHRKDSPDGETPTVISVTRENNGYAVWRTDYDGEKMLEFVRDRNSAIEQGVEIAKVYAKELKTAQAA
jgi:hypothetical protein